MSSEEQYKYIEDKIKEAANAAQYDFKEASWKNMEALLEQKRDIRRPFFWIFSSLLLGILFFGGAMIYQSINKNEQSKNNLKQIVNRNNEQQTQVPLKTESNLATIEQLPEPIKNEHPNNITPGNNIISKDKEYIDENNLKGKSNKQSPIVTFRPMVLSGTKYKLKTNSRKNENLNDDKFNTTDKYIYKDKSKFALKIISPEQQSDPGIVESKKEKPNDAYLTAINNIIPEFSITEITKPEAESKPDTAEKKSKRSAKEENKKNQKNNGFYILATTGLDLNSTKLLSFNNSTVTPFYGAGFGYQFNRRLGVQTGFYASAKKYIAGPYDYNVKAGSYLSMVKIISVDANCMVYEVPVTIQYNWLIKPKANYYASLGISSYIMKKEKYNYTYERNNTQYSYPYDYTKNTHLLASLELSLGIEKQIGRKLYIQATPVVNLPLQGVGEGRVKIFTTGLHVSLKYIPFKH
jgi:hypothetical protein